MNDCDKCQKDECNDNNNNKNDSKGGIYSFSCCDGRC